MLDKRLYIHPKEEALLKNMLETVAFGDEVMFYYKNYTEKIRKPDLLGKTVKVTQRQFEDVYDIARCISDTYDMEMPEIYVYEDFYYGVESKGAASPWLEISAKTIMDLTEKELTFLIAKEMCEIHNKHTYYFTLVNEMMETLRGNASLAGLGTLSDIWKITMYKWCRAACYSSDCFGYIACGSISSSASAITRLVLNNVRLADSINMAQYLKQAEEINLLDEEVHSFTKGDEMVPYGPFRIKNLISYASSDRGISARKYLKG